MSPAATSNRNRVGGSAGGGMGMGLVRSLYNILAVILRTILYPVCRLCDLLLPPGEFDGLNDAVTEKAAQHFLTYLKGLASSQAQLSGIMDGGFSTLGFSALGQEAANTHAIIVVYLHAPYHRNADHACKKLLLSSSMLEFIRQDNVKALCVSTQSSQGAYLANQLAATSFPVMALLQPTKQSSTRNSSNSASVPVKLVFKAEGPSLTRLSPGQVVSLLTATFQRFQLTVLEQEQRRFEREQADELRRQQDAEYQESLRADQERERQQREEREREEQLKQQEEEREQQTVQAERDRLDQARALILPEPDKTTVGQTSGDATMPTRVRFQLPTGQKLERRFWSDETIASLKAFLVLHFAEQYEAEAERKNNGTSHMIKNVALSENFPKKRHDDDTLTLRESGLCPQAVLMVQDLDA